MDTGLFAQYIVVALAVAASVGVVVRKQFPQATRRLRIAVAVRLLGEGHAPWIKALGRTIAPTPRHGAANCSGCDSCD